MSEPLYQFLRAHQRWTSVLLLLFCGLALAVALWADKDTNVWAIGAALAFPGLVAVFSAFLVVSGRLAAKKLMIYALLGAVVTLLSHAFFYEGVGLLMPIGGTNVEKCPEFGDALYFSIVTFTTLGYGDIHPVEKFRLLSALQAIYGYMYLGLIVGLIANFVSQRKKGTQNSTEEDD